MPFFDLDNTHLISDFFGDGTKPCKKCKQDCIAERISCTQCIKCHKWQHEKCTASHSFMVDNFLCSAKCEMSLLPFCNFNNFDLASDDILSSSSITAVKSTTKTNHITPKNVSNDNFVSNPKRS